MSKNLFKGFLIVFIFITQIIYLSAIEKNALELYKKGHLAEIQEDYLTAIEMYKTALLTNPNYVDPLEGLSRAYYAIEEFDEALEYIDKAIMLDRKNQELYNVKGQIYIGLGNYRDAQTVFKNVLLKEPNNLDAQYGIAEIDILTGKVIQARMKYMDSLKISPTSKKALIKIVELSNEANDQYNALKYLELALKAHPNDPEINMTAARYYVANRDFESAEYYAKTALSLRKDFFDGMQYLGIIYLMQGKSAEAIEVLNTSLTIRKAAKNFLARYILGYAHSLAGNKEEAVKQYAAALNLRYDDEISRLACESLFLKNKGLADYYRSVFSGYHLEQGRLLEEQNVLKSALMEYRRALRLDPDSKEARLAYAYIYKRLGFQIKYLFLLKFLSDSLGYKDNAVLDDIDVTMPRYYESVAYKWSGILNPDKNNKGSDEKGQVNLFDQYSLDRMTIKISLFTDNVKNVLFHPFAAPFLLEYIQDLFLWYDSFSIMNSQALINSYQEAFKQAQVDNSDYFLILQFVERERTFQLDGVLYLTRTGSEVKRFTFFRTGNNKIQNGLLKLTEDLVKLFPLRGTLLAREFDRGIINLGRIHGIKEGDMFLIIKRNKVKLSTKDVNVVFSDEDIIGSFKVTTPDENLSEGTISKRTFFDFINPMDEVVLVNSKDNGK